MHLLELMAHIEICCFMLLALPWLCVPLLMCPSGGPFHVCLLHEPHLALRSCRSSRILEVVHLSWQAVCEGHCHRVVADQPSEGLVTGSCVHVWCRSSGPWPASLSLWYTVVTSSCVCLAAHVLSPRSHRSRLGHISCTDHVGCPHVLVPMAMSHGLAMWSASACISLTHG